jgi:DNA-binding GntR family transcriptional regulator
MGQYGSKMPKEVIKNIFPRKLKRHHVSEDIYFQLRHGIVSGKLKKGDKLIRDAIAADFDVSERIVTDVFAQLKKEGLVIVIGNSGSFVA